MSSILVVGCAYAGACVGGSVIVTVTKLPANMKRKTTDVQCVLTWWSTNTHKVSQLHCILLCLMSSCSRTKQVIMAVLKGDRTCLYVCVH